MKWELYSEYKPSGVQLLGEIPTSWDTSKIKWIAQAYSGTDNKDELGNLPLYGANGIIGKTYGPSITSAKVLVGRVGSAGSVNLAHPPFGVSDNAIVLDNVERIHTKYLYYVLSIQNFTSEVSVNAQPLLTASAVKDLVIPFPATKDQRAIASFLDRETTRIDALIEKKERQIELLQEKRAALIHDAIHDPSTQTMRIGHVADQIFRPIDRRDEDIYTPVGLYNRGRGIFHKEPTTGDNLGDSDFFWLEKDDLILSGQFAWEGAVALASEEEAGCVATHRYPILRGKPDLMETAYLFAFLTTRTGDFLLNEHSRGAAGRNRPLNTGTLLKESIPVPPLRAQARVSTHVYFERRIGRVAARSVQLLKEYRIALISVAVAGRIDVRGEVA